THILFMRILLVRHAQTIENAEHRFQGHIHGRLSALGKRQTKALALALENEKIDYFFGSPLDRARDTLEAIRKNHPHIEAVFTDDLKERGKGVWEGRFVREAYAENPRLRENMRNKAYRPEKGESLLDVRRRLKRFLKIISGVDDESTILITGHGILNGELLRLLLKTEGHFSQQNACVNEIWWEKSGTYVVKLNDVSHLKKLGLGNSRGY
ncbi:MAG: histidine phosphatase family protein, partial [Candidatus Micrarchaeota archaeon]|nr:histidine phosphatase family protein [Candidatus Micrarchaeota archaeon]